MEEPETIKDIIGREVQVGDYIAFNQSYVLGVGRIERFTPKTIRVNGKNIPKSGTNIVLLPTNDVKRHLVMKELKR
jgi:hypothetical protein